MSFDVGCSVPSLDSQSEYKNRMHRVLAHIDEHLDEQLVLATLAEVAHFFPFHFHRLFSAWMSETLGDYLRHLGPYGEAIAQFWQDTYYPWAVSNNLLEQARYGIGYDDPGITAAERCRYDACVEVAPDFVLSGGALKTTIPGGKYAVLRYSGKSERVVDAWTALLREWLPSLLGNGRSYRA